MNAISWCAGFFVRLCRGRDPFRGAEAWAWLHVAAACVLVGRLAADEPAVNLLRLPNAKLERHSKDLDANALALLTDGKESTVAHFATPPEGIEAVYYCGERLVTVEKLSFRIPAGAAPLQIEVLASTVSSASGFSLLRSEWLKPKSNSQQFTIPATAARWLLMRFVPQRAGADISVAEVEILGYEGPPATRYAFRESPAKVFDVLSRLKKSSRVDIAISADEAALFDDADDGKLDKWTFAEAALLASGVYEGEQRRKYLRALDELEGQAKLAIASADTPFAKGEKLLAWLHDKQGPLGNGYETHQTDLSTLLDTGKFNCVSSAVLFSILGRRLGLDVRAIEVPDHAFAIVYDGTRHADVETTNALGFNPARDPAAIKEFEQQTGLRYIADSHRDQRREVSESGLIAIICYNHGVTLTAEKRHHEALLAYFRAMSLDKEFASAVKNSLASLVNWGMELAKRGEFESALNVISIGLELAPEDASLKHNRKAAYAEWADSLGAEGRDDQAIEVLRRAAKEIPDGNFVTLQSWLFLRRGESLADDKKWDEALRAVAPGLDKVDATAKEEMLKWQTGVYQRWAQAELEKKSFDRAMQVLVDGLERTPSDSTLSNNLAYTLQEWARHVYQTQGEEAAKKILSTQCQRFPKNEALREVARNHARSVFVELRDAGKFEQALSAVKFHSEFLKDDSEQTRLLCDSYIAWASSFADQRKWDEATKVYENGIRALPKERSLEQNLAFTIQEWTQQTLSESGKPQAKKLLIDQLNRFPKLSSVRDVAENHVQGVVVPIIDDGKFSDALATLDEHKELLPDDKSKQLAVNIYDRWAGKHRDMREWQEALDVYAQALKRHPDDSHLTRNAVATWHAWAKPDVDSKNWKAAIGIYEKALEQFPKDGTLRNNSEYCKQQLKDR